MSLASLSVVEALQNMHVVGVPAVAPSMGEVTGTEHIRNCRMCLVMEVTWMKVQVPSASWVEYGPC